MAPTLSSGLVLPLDVADCTPAFFADAFERDVTSAELLDRSSGTTGRARFALRGDPALPATVFVKLAPFDETQRAFVTSVGMGVAEARFYRDLAGDVPVRVPHAYYAETEGDQYVMVLEDLDASGCRFPHPKDADIEFRARNIVEQLATLHAQYWESPRFDEGGDLAWLSSKGTGDAGGGSKFIKMAVDSLGSQLGPDFARIADLYLARTGDIVKLWGARPRTLVHGDPHMGNLFVDEAAGGRTGFLDWAVLSHAPGMRDVAYVLCNSVPADVRAAGEKEWLARYCELLGEAGVQFSRDDAWRQYRLFAVYSWVAAAATAGMGSKWQPLHIGLEGTERATVACTALGSVELLEELLG
jgi:aminoglycoside/choline kinase family phosphotransferase